MKKIIILIIILTPCFLISQSLGKERIDKLNKSVVRILIEDDPVGTGFFIDEKGYIATCLHVVSPSFIFDKTTKKMTGHKKLFIEFQNGEKEEVGIHKYFLEKSSVASMAYDFIFLGLLKKPVTKFTTLKIGSWSEIEEGDEVYTCGYPLGIEQRIISKGLFSTKWIEKIKGENISERNVSWLDLTMNRGNSGGAIIKLGKTPSEDKVIGIATFILNPFANYAQSYADHLDNPNLGYIEMNGVNSNQVNKLFAKA